MLRPWQKKFVRDVYEPANKKNQRIVRRAILSIARKNGKTALLAALVLVHLVGPEAIPHGEIYSAANDRRQAAQIFKFAAQMVRLDPELRPLIKIVDSTKRMIGRRTASIYEAMSAEAGTKHGLNPTFVIFDELAQAKNRELYDVLDTSFGAQPEPLFVVISTQSNDPEHVLSKLIDDGLNAGDPRIVCHLYEVPLDVEDIYDEKVWRLANPAIGDFRLLDDFRALADKAQRSPSEEPKFRNLYLNQRVDPRSSLITRHDWQACEGAAEFEDGEDVYLGLDLSSVNDLTALVMVSANGIRVRPFLWKPEETLVSHSKRDFGSNDFRFVEWERDGHLLTTPGRTIDATSVAMKIAELCSRYNVLGMSFDRWRMDILMKELDALGLSCYKDGDAQTDGLRIVPWGQGFKDMTPAVDALEMAVIEGKLQHPGNPALTWNVMNAIVLTDPSGNRKLDKSAARFRIDGAVALVEAIGLRARDIQEDVGLMDRFLSDPIEA